MEIHTLIGSICRIKKQEHFIIYQPYGKPGSRGKFSKCTENARRRLGIVDNKGNIGVKEKPWLVP